MESILPTFATAVDVLDRHLGIHLPFYPEKQEPGFKPKSVLVLGGNSELGRFIIQLLRLAVPEAVIVANCYSDEPEKDVFKTWPSVWTTCAIDGDYETRLDPEELCEGTEKTLVEELRKWTGAYAHGQGGYKVIIDVAGKMVDRPEFESLLVGPNKCMRKDDMSDVTELTNEANGVDLRGSLRTLLQRGFIVPIPEDAAGAA